VDAASGATVAVDHKVGFCHLDTLHPYPWVPGSPRRRHYRSCRRNSVQEQSVGYADIYECYVADQWIDVTVSRPASTAWSQRPIPVGQLLEANEADNACRQGIRLGGHSVLPLAEPC
jgi:hypothetical protein